MTTDLLFVYGTLKRGLRNHRLLASAQFVGEARTEERRFRLLDCGPYPALIEIPADATGTEPLQIRGEVYRITPAHLPALDELEDEGTLYRRTTITVALDAESASPLFAYTYVWLGRSDRFPPVAGDVWPISS